MQNRPSCPVIGGITSSSARGSSRPAPRACPPPPPVAVATVVAGGAFNSKSKYSIDDFTIIRVLGKGANLLVDDSGVDGIVVRLDHEAFTRLRFNAHGQVDRVLAMAGADLFASVQEFSRQGLAGFTQMAGIPGTIGGAVRMYLR